MSPGFTILMFFKTKGNISSNEVRILLVFSVGVKVSVRDSVSVTASWQKVGGQNVGRPVDTSVSVQSNW